MTEIYMKLRGLLATNPEIDIKETDRTVEKTTVSHSLQLSEKYSD